MRIDFYQVLIEQSIVLIITSWECYFSDIIERIFNEDLFIENAFTNNPDFNKFLNYFKSTNEFNVLVADNNGSLKNLNFGTFLIDKKKVSCQRLNDVKKIFKTFFDYIDLVMIEERKWTDIVNLFDSRHSIIHNQDEDILSTYDKDEILLISKSIFNIISYVDEHLFTFYNGKILEF